MIKRNNLEVFLEKIPRCGMSKGFQKILPHIAKQYFNGKSKDQLEISEKNKKYVDPIWRRLEGIKINGLKKVGGVRVFHYKSRMEPQAFADAILEYCMNCKKGLQTKLVNTLKEPKINADFLKKLYRVKKVDEENDAILKRVYKEGEGRDKDDKKMSKKDEEEKQKRIAILKRAAHKPGLYIIILDHVLD